MNKLSIQQMESTQGGLILVALAYLVGLALGYAITAKILGDI